MSYMLEAKLPLKLYAAYIKTILKHMDEREI